MKRWLSRYRDPDGLVHISIGYNDQKSAMRCEVRSLMSTFKWNDEDLHKTDKPATCLECVRESR